jgi:hypothetical protein
MVPHVRGVRLMCKFLKTLVLGLIGVQSAGSIGCSENPRPIRTEAISRDDVRTIINEIQDKAIGAHIISLYVDRHGDFAVLRDRRLVGDVVECHECTIQQLSRSPRWHAHEHNDMCAKLYSVKEPNAVEMFNALSRLLAQGHAYRSEEFAPRTSAAQYIVTTGGVSGLVANEGGMGEGLFEQVVLWRDYLIDDKIPPDAEVSLALFDDRALTSTATLCAMALFTFDDLSIVASMTNVGDRNGKFKNGDRD